MEYSACSSAGTTSETLFSVHVAVCAGGTSLIGTHLGQVEVSRLVRCSDFRGRVVLFSEVSRFQGL